MPLVRQLVWLALLGGLATGAWFAFSDRLLGTTGPTETATYERNRPAPVVVAPVEMVNEGATVEAVGTGLARREVTLYPEAAGRVVELLFASGADVEAGAPLLRLDDEEERLALELARVNVADAEQRLARYEQAAPSGAVSQSEVDAARTTLEGARIERRRAELALHRRTLEAPFDGIMGIPQVEIGDRIDETTPVATLDDRSSLLVVFEVPEAAAGALQPGDPVEATTWALPGARFDGVVEDVGSRLDPATRTLTVRARLPNENDRLRPGMAFTMAIVLRGEERPAVPSIAVLWDSDGAHVWAVRDAAAVRVPVRIVKRGEGTVLVDAPLGSGDRVVVEGTLRLRDGAAVEVVDTVAAGIDG